MYDSNSKKSSQITLGDFILVIFLPDPLFSSQIPPSTSICHGDYGSVCLKCQKATATLLFKTPRVCSFETSKIILGSTTSRQNNRERASCAPPFLAMRNAHDHQYFLTNTSAYLLPRLEFVPESKVSPKTSCRSHLYCN